MWVKKKVYVIICFFSDFEHSGFQFPSEEFCVDSEGEALKLQERLLTSLMYCDVVKVTYSRWLRGFLYLFLLLFNFNNIYKLIRNGSLFNGSGHRDSGSGKGKGE